MSTRIDKRSRLVEAAKSLIHQQGYNQTTLAEIAEKAMVPLGNVYYYFKTKDAIGSAVLADYTKYLTDQLAVFNKLPHAKDRLLTLISQGLQPLSDTLAYGCALGSLCLELSKTANDLAETTTLLMNNLAEWVKKQLIDLGCGEKAEVYTWYLLAQLQGMALLATTFKDPVIVHNQQRLLHDWLEGLAVNA